MKRKIGALEGRVLYGAPKGARILPYSVPYMGQRATHGRSRKKKSGTPMKMNRNMSTPRGRSFSRDAKSAHRSLFFRRLLF